LHPLWDRYQRITPIKPQPPDAPFIWRWRDVEPLLQRSVGEVSINDIERRALIMAHPAFGAETTTTSTLLAAFTVLNPATPPPARRPPAAPPPAPRPAPPPTRARRPAPPRARRGRSPSSPAGVARGRRAT